MEDTLIECVKVSSELLQKAYRKKDEVIERLCDIIFVRFLERENFTILVCMSERKLKSYVGNLSLVFMTAFKVTVVLQLSGQF